MYSAAIDELIEKFERLPGIGHKSAERIAFYLLENMTEAEAEAMAQTEAKIKAPQKRLSSCGVKICVDITFC